jgi:putative endonuclease
MVVRAQDVLGKTGEQVAADYLQSCKSCGPADPQPELAQRGREIDIVAVERRVLVVCEVKSRTSTRYGSPLEAVSRAKRKRLRKFAGAVAEHPRDRFDQIRIDVVGLVYEGADGFTIEHIRGVG